MKKIILISLFGINMALEAQINLGLGMQYNFENLGLKYSSGLSVNSNHFSMNIRGGYSKLFTSVKSIRSLDTNIYFNTKEVPHSLTNETQITPKLGWEVELNYKIPHQKIDLHIGTWISKSSHVSNRTGFAYVNAYLNNHPNNKTLAIFDISYLDTIEKSNVTAIGISLGLSVNIGKHLLITAAFRPSMYRIKNSITVQAEIFAWDRTQNYGFIPAQNSRIAYTSNEIIFRPLAAPVIGMSYLIFSE